MNETSAIESVVRSFCTFRADGRLYGIDVAHLREVSTHVATTPVPQAPPAIRGLINLRSRIYLVIDLRPLLGLADVPCTADSRLIILKPELGEDLGVLVDSGGGVVRVKGSDIEAPGQSASGGGETPADVPPSLSGGVCKLESELMVILDPVAIASDVARQVRMTSGPSIETQTKEIIP
jgi:purine-binding chemotaxis protein CheW